VEADAEAKVGNRRKVPRWMGSAALHGKQRFDAALLLLARSGSDRSRAVSSSYSPLKQGLKTCCWSWGSEFKKRSSICWSDNPSALSKKAKKPTLVSDNHVLTCTNNGITRTLKNRTVLIDKNIIRETVTTQEGQFVDKTFYHRVSEQ
jgi:hypothetical protein